MIVALLLIAAEPMTAIEAERAFAADAQKLGQWTAFRKYAADEAMMFVPQPVNALAWLKDKNDPPVSVFWWPGRSYVSCDGTVAVNTGPWVREWGKAIGYFTTVWVKRPDGSWKWVYDAGDELKTARAEGGDVKPQRAMCEKLTGPVGFPPNLKISGERSGGAESADGSLAWKWTVERNGSRSFQAYVWNGEFMEEVIHDKVAAPPK